MVSPLTLSSLAGLAKPTDTQAVPPSRAVTASRAGKLGQHAGARPPPGAAPDGPPLPRGSLLDRLA